MELLQYVLVSTERRPIDFDLRTQCITMEIMFVFDTVYLLSFAALIWHMVGRRSQWLLHDLVSISRHCSRIRSHERTWVFVSRTKRIRTMCTSMGRWNESRRKHSFDCEWCQLCHYDSVIHYYRLSGRLWSVWAVATLRNDSHMLGCPICQHEFDG